MVDYYDGVRVADRNGGEFDDLAVSEVDLVSISPTFYEQLLRQKSFRQKITSPNCKRIKAAQKKTFAREKAAHKILVKLTPGTRLIQSY